MTDMESLDIRRPADLSAIRTARLTWLDRYRHRQVMRKALSAARRKESNRLVVHLVAATLPALRERAKLKRRWWPWLLAVYGTPIALAASAVVALWLLGLSPPCARPPI